jgi:hypothetical protein
MTQDGTTIETRPLFIMKCPITGEMTTGSDSGGDINGMLNR